MCFDKQVLYTFNMPYALGWMERDGQRCVVAATEDHGPIVISAPPYTSAEVLVDGPGGCMSLVSHPLFPGELFAIMGCFLGYNFHGGAVYRVTASGPSANAAKIADLPFGHRMEIVDRNGPTLVVANLASVKDSPQDWSQTGSVYALPLDGQPAELSVVLPGIHKNHGFLKTEFEGRPSILISGEEGLFALDLKTERWNVTQVLTHEISEIAVFDLDGDGQQELVTIEPFHGNRLVVYKNQTSGWTPVWEAALDYGHCVLAEVIAGKPSILVSNRAGTKDLLLFQFDRAGLLRPTRTVVDTGNGAANMLVVHRPQGDLIIATNQTQGELVRYELS